VTSFEEEITMQDFSEFFDECDRGPRLNQLAAFFAETAAGRSGMPLHRPLVDMRLLPADALLHQLIGIHSQRQGFFDQHYHASIPYRLEEECRMAHALLRFSQTRPNGLHVYSLGTAEGTMARVISEMSGGRIRSLACSPNEENYKSFMAYGAPVGADFFVGPFHRLTKEHLRSNENLAPFVDGFDVILEDTTFQMYSPNRRAQIDFVAQHLKPGGIMLFLEKFRALDSGDYQAREEQKNLGFKAHYFGTDEIARKTALVLNTMHECEVGLSEMADAVYAQFTNCMVTWNSGNFYGLAASNDAENLGRYLTAMIQPAIPVEYVYEPRPYSDLATWLSQHARSE
jgi:SAM-dependent methyltransferase